MGIVRSLEEMRSALLALAWPGGQEPSGRTQVVMFAKPADFDRAVTLGAMAAGVAFSQPGQERVMSFSTGAEGGVPRFALHELVHNLSHWFMPMQPPWFAEGLAVYLESVRLDREAGVALMGDMSATSVEWMNRTKVLMRSSKLFSAKSYHSNDDMERSSFYSSSWFLVHYLLNEQGEAFGQFQRGLSRRVPWKRAWQEAFPTTTNDQLDQDVLTYSRRGKFFEVGAKVTLPVFEPSERVLSPAEVHGVRARLASAFGREKSEADMRAALELDANELNALVVQFQAAEPGSSIRSEIAARAVAAHPKSAEAWLLQAWASESGEPRQKAAEQAAQFAPDHPGVSWLLAEGELQRNRPNGVLRHVRHAQRSSAPAPDMLSLEIAALRILGRCTEAQEIAISADDLFSECRMTVQGRQEQVPCSEALWNAYRPAEARCQAALPTGSAGKRP